MQNYVTLLGAEDVQRAGHVISEAASQMNLAATSFDASVDRLERILEDHATRIEAAQEKETR